MAEDWENETHLYYTRPNGKSFKAPVSVPDNDIREYLKQEGFDDDAIDKTMAHPKSHSEYMGGVLSGIPKSIISGLGQGIAGIPDLLNQTTSTGIEPDLRKTGGIPDTSVDPKNWEKVPTFENQIGRVVGGWHDPQNDLEKYLQVGAQGALPGLAAPGSFLPKMFAYGVGPAMLGQAASDTAGSFGASPSVQAGANIATSALTGGKIAKTITRNPMGPVEESARLRAAEVTQKELGRGSSGLTAGQYKGDPEQLQAEINARPRLPKEQQAQFMRRVTRPVGETSADVTAGEPTDYLNRNFNRVSGRIERVANQTQVDPTAVGPVRARNWQQYNNPTNPQIFDDLSEIQKDLNQRAPKGQIHPYVDKALELFKSVNGNWAPKGAPIRGPNGQFQAGPVAKGNEYHNALFGQNGDRPINGQDYSRLRSLLYSTAESADDPKYAHHLRGIADSLDNSMENSLHVNNPNLVGEWQGARDQYRNLLVVEKARQLAKTDRFDPEHVASAVSEVQGSRPYLRGQTDYGWIEKAKKVRDEFPKPEKAPDYTGSGAAAIAGIGSTAALMAHGLPLHEAATPAILANMVGGDLAKAPVTGKIIKGLSSHFLEPLDNFLGKIGSKFTMSRPYQASGKNQLLPALPENFDARRNAAILQALRAGNLELPPLQDQKQ